MKQTFAAHAGRWESLPAGGERWAGETPAVEWIVKSPVTASEREVARRVRAWRRRRWLKAPLLVAVAALAWALTAWARRGR